MRFWVNLFIGLKDKKTHLKIDKKLNKKTKMNSKMNKKEDEKRKKSENIFHIFKVTI